MDRFSRLLAGLLGRAARLLPGRRREWAEAALNESGQVPAGARRAAWLGGGLWLVTREALIRGGWRMIAFAAGAAAFVWFSWPGPSSNSALLLNRAWMAGTLLILAGLPLVIRRQLGPVRGGWVARAVRVGGYALILVMIAAKAVKDRDGFVFLLLAPFVGLVLGGVAATAASAGLPRPVLSGARPGPGDDGTRATAPGDA